MECCVHDCGVKGILGRFDDGAFSMSLCPNHQIMYFLGMIKHTKMHLFPSQETSRKSCTLCDQQAIVFEDHDATYELCRLHMEKLIRRNLSPQEFSVLYQKHGNTFLLHEDFYDENGNAIQPV